MTISKAAQVALVALGASALTLSSACSVLTPGGADAGPSSASDDGGMGSANAAPTCAITAPAADTHLALGEVAVFTAALADAESAPELLSIAWASNVDGMLGGAAAAEDGTATLSTDALSAGQHTIGLRAEDPRGAFCTAELNVTVGARPVVAWTAPAADHVVSTGIDVVFEASVSHPEDAALSFAWASDVDGALGAGTVSGDVASLQTAALSAGAHTVTLTVTDSHGLTASASGTVRIDARPSAPVVQIEPDVVDTLDDLVATASATDAEGDALSYAYSWFADDAVIDGETTETLSAAKTAAGVTYRVDVVAFDGRGEGEIGSASITVQNAAPAITAAVDLAAARVGDTVTCTADASDVDGDVPTVTYAWSDGQTGAAVTLTTAHTPGSTLTCTATATDAAGEARTATAEVQVDNTPPSASATLSAQDARVGDTLTCTALVLDANGDTPAVTYAWHDGHAGPSYTLSTADLPGERVQCTVTATDAHGGTATARATATVLSTAPTVVASVDVSEAEVGTQLTCSAVADDADAGTPNVTYRWSTGTLGPVYRLTASDAVGADVTCTATATDAQGLTARSTASVTVLNTAPSVTAAVSNASARVGDTVTCAGDPRDVNGDVPVVTYAWSDGQTGAAFTVDSAVSPGTQVTCTATATDAQGATAEATAVFTVANTDPVLTASVDRAVVVAGDTLNCAAEASDENGDTPTVSYVWNDGLAGATRVVTAADAPGAVLMCVATARDAHGGAATATAQAVVNSAPVVAVAFAPDAPEAGAIVACQASANDVDGGELTVAYAWHDGSTAETFDTAGLAPGTTLTCTATATDTFGAVGTASESVTVQNTLPTVVASVDVATPGVGDTVTCAGAASDANGDVPVVTYAWSNGATTAAYTLVETDDPDDVLTCTVTATDAHGGVATDSVDVTVVNTPPAIDVSVSPAEPDDGDPVTCTAVATDVDGDTPNVVYAWSDGTEGPTNIFEAADLGILHCIVTATDAHGAETEEIARFAPPVVGYGVKTNVSRATIEAAGWIACYEQTYGEPTNTTTQNLRDACRGRGVFLLVGCVENATPDNVIAAAADLEDVVLPTADDVHHTYREGEGNVSWYLVFGKSFGFFETGDGVSQNSADTATGSFPAHRLSWHAHEGSGVGGYRCGAQKYLNGSATWTKIIWAI